MNGLYSAFLCPYKSKRPLNLNYVVGSLQPRFVTLQPSLTWPCQAGRLSLIQPFPNSHGAPRQHPSSLHQLEVTRCFGCSSRDPSSLPLPIFCEHRYSQRLRNFRPSNPVISAPEPQATPELYRSRAFHRKLPEGAPRAPPRNRRTTTCRHRNTYRDVNLKLRVLNCLLG